MSAEFGVDDEPVAEVTPALRLAWLVDSDRAHRLVGAKLYAAPRPAEITADLLADLKMQHGMVGTRDKDVTAWNAKLDRAIAALSGAFRKSLRDMTEADFDEALSVPEAQDEAELERALFYKSCEEHLSKCGHKPTQYDIWLMGRGIMDTNGRAIVPEVRNFSFDGWPAGETPLEFFDKKRWLECLHACICAVSRQTLMDTGVLHELCHLALGLETDQHSNRPRLRERVATIQQEISS